MYDTVIIGAGPAGLTAGLYAGRYRLKTLMLEKIAVGGQILLSATIENFPGFPGGVMTADLIERIKEQVDDLGVETRYAEVSGIAVEGATTPQTLTVTTSEGALQAKSVIIAAGAHWKRLKVPGEEKLVGRGVSFCATCDAPLFRNKETVVVGGGDKAIEEAIFLSKYASRVTVVHRRKGLRATEILQEQAKAEPKISFVLDSVVEEIIGDGKVEGVSIKDVANGRVRTIPCQGVFVFIGIAPSTEFLQGTVAMDESGFVITDTKCKTSLPGVFACGDCREKHLYQVITACADGAEAAHAAHNYLLHHR